MDFGTHTVGCIGCGTMGGAIIKALSKSYPAEQLFVTAKNKQHAQTFAQNTKVQALEQNIDLANKCDFIFLGVKPAYVKDVLAEIKDSFCQKKILISMAAGVTIKAIQEELDRLFAQNTALVMPHIFRIMPNLPATIGEAMTALCASEDSTVEEQNIVIKLLSTSGKVEPIPEHLMDGVTAVSGSGPAYAFLFIEALADAAVRFGLPRKQAYVYAAQTLKGAACMALEDERSISELKDAVCSPAGTTIEAVATLERLGFRSSIIEAATSAYNKSLELKHKS